MPLPIETNVTRGFQTEVESNRSRVDDLSAIQKKAHPSPLSPPPPSCTIPRPTRLTIASLHLPLSSNDIGIDIVPSQTPSTSSPTHHHRLMDRCSKTDCFSFFKQRCSGILAAGRWHPSDLWMTPLYTSLKLMEGMSAAYIYRAPVRCVGFVVVKTGLF